MPANIFNIASPGLMVFHDFLDTGTYREVMDNIKNFGENPESPVQWERAGVDKRKKTDEKVVKAISEARTNSSTNLVSFYKNAEDPYYQLVGKTADILVDNIKPAIETYHIHYPDSRTVNDIPINNILLRYNGGEKYDQHNDWSPVNKRLISYLLYLNDEYTGGELEFPQLGIRFKPAPNSFVVFPSNYLFSHIAHPVESGTKYAVVNWITHP